MARVVGKLKGKQYKIAAQAGNPKKIEKADFKKLAQLRKGKKNSNKILFSIIFNSLLQLIRS